MRTLHAAAAVPLLALSACTGDIDYIDIDPDVAILRQKNNVIWLRARAMSNAGRQYPQVTATWTVKDPEIARVDETGKLTPVKSGRTEVMAKIREVSASIPVEVLFAEKLKIEPEKLELAEWGEPAEFKVKVYDYLGRELRDRTATFKSFDPKVLTMGQNAAHPGNAGQTEVEVRVDELVERVNVTVKKK